MTEPDNSRQQVAEAVRDALWAGDRASRSLGMQVLGIAPGSATLTMVASRATTKIARTRTILIIIGLKS